MPEMPPLQHLLELRKATGARSTYDLTLHQVQALKRFRTFECHVVLYPYSRDISSADFFFHPFEEYVEDLAKHRRSAYTEVASAADHAFGLGLGVVLAGLAMRYGPSTQALSIEALGAWLGAFFVGKSLWPDVERYLTNLTERWPLRFIDPVYRYRLQRFHTLTHYSTLARYERYNRPVMLPERLDFIQECNSQTVRMEFDMADFAALADASAHLLTIQVDSEHAQAFERAGSMLGLKLSFNERRLGVWRSYEVFQSIHKNEPGCMDQAGQWIPRAAFFRRTRRVGRLKRFVAAGLLPDVEIVKREG